MITYHDAFAKANHYLDDADLPVVITLHGRFSQGWYFCFEAREFLETGDEAARLAGNAPFIIDKDSDDYQKIKDTKNVIPKYSPKYYWLLYRANAIISTEAASHLNVLISANSYLRLKMVEYEFVWI